MASYFDIKPPSKATAESSNLLKVNDDEVERTFGKGSLLSPQVTSILDGLEDGSSSDEEDEDDNSNSSDGEEEERGRKGKKEQNSNYKSSPLRKSQTSPLPSGNKKINPAPSSSRPNLGVPGSKGKHPHLARFHSLRSMLFSSRIEDNFAQMQESEAEIRWKSEHEQRQGLNRPKTPESGSPSGSPEGSPTKPGLGQRMSSRLKRLTSKEAPTVADIKEEDEGEESTASDDVEPSGGAAYEGGKKWDERMVSDDESIHHSDVDDLVRWVSRRDPPSDGEARKSKKLQQQPDSAQLGVHDSGHESLAPEDVDELVRWISRRPEQYDEGAAMENVEKSEYSDAPTESDSENEGGHEPLEDDDVDNLVRWISRKEGDRAGPVRPTARNASGSGSGTISEANDSDTAELVRWVTKHDETSGESDVDAAARRSRAKASSTEGSTNKHRDSLGDDDVDELVRWVSKREDEKKDSLTDGGHPLKSATTPGGADSLLPDPDNTKLKTDPLKGAESAK